MPECLVDVEVQCCCDVPPGEEIPDCECPCVEVVLSNPNGFNVYFEVTHPITMDVCNDIITAGGPDVEVHLCGPFPDGNYLISVYCEDAGGGE